MRRLIVAAVFALLALPARAGPFDYIDIYAEKVDSQYYNIEFHFRVWFAPRWTVTWFHESNCKTFLEWTGDKCLWVLKRGPRDEPNISTDMIGFIFRF